MFNVFEGCRLWPRFSIKSRPRRFPFRDNTLVELTVDITFFLVSHHMYTIVKHLSACLINIDMALMQHASLPLAVEEKLLPGVCSLL
jgi:hypothetical protein